MSINKALITPAEADVILAAYPDWLALTEDQKTQHIAVASTYVQLGWNCLYIDWSDTSTLTDEVKEATAYYALADSQGTLYPPVDGGTEPVGGNVIETTDEVGSLRSTVKYDSANAAEPTDVLTYPNSLMSYGCDSLSKGGSVKAIRT